MKLLSLIILSVSLVACDNPQYKGSRVKTKEGVEIIYQTVVIDGNEYYLARTHPGNFTLCPKLPPKAEK